MNLAISRIKEILPHFNERPLTEEDFWLICETEKIKVFETTLIVNGFYFADENEAVIYLNSALRGIDWLENAFHELAHHFLHTPPQSRKQEREAQAIALMALIPSCELEKTVCNSEDLCERARSILHKRLEILSKHGL